VISHGRWALSRSLRLLRCCEISFLKDMAAELGQHEVVGPGLLHPIIIEVQRRYDIADQRRTGLKRHTAGGWLHSARGTTEKPRQGSGAK
jgi:hypothetical protein